MRQLLILAMLCPVLCMCQPLALKGKVYNEEAEPLANVTVALKRSSTIVQRLATTGAGSFAFSNLQIGDSLLFTAVGYEATSVLFDEALVRFPELTVRLQRRTSLLDETVIIAYGKTTRRLSTGSVSRITAAEIATQPVSNPLSALQGRIAGLLITQQNGLPGSNFTVLIRGRSSLQQGTAPFYIVDGVPFSPDNLSQRSGTLNASSPFASLNPSDIESIEVLKDADATAIYGSRGANGVILITTKKGRAGNTSLEVNGYTGYSSLARRPAYLSTADYLALRRQAFAADGVMPTVANAPDLTVWDSSRYTNWADNLAGGTAHTQNETVRLSGGGELTSFSLGLGYNRQTTVFPTAVADNRYTAHLNLAHSARDKRFSVAVSLLYTSEKNALPLTDLTQYLTLAPNLPSLYDSTGKLAWAYGNATFTNPLGLVRQVYEGTTDLLNGNLQLSYTLVRGLVLRSSLGYTTTRFDEYTATPISAQSPLISPKGSATFAGNNTRTWIAEPQLDYRIAAGKFSLQALLGGSFQRSENRMQALSGAGYTNDALLGSVAGAATLTASNAYSLYKYEALFGRLTFNWASRYLLNLTIRYDGSSRFGPGRQFAPFGSAGGAWIFSAEPFIKKAFPFLSYGKLRGSYGTTGNDQIGNYQYLDSWGNTVFSFQGIATIRPLRLNNPDYSWERTRKAEAALEVGLWGERLVLTATVFQTRSDNQLITYSLPSQTGFTGIVQNFPGKVQNRGLELEGRFAVLRGQRFSWQSFANFTLSRNKLLAFPGLATSSYANTYRVGEPTSVRLGYRYTGINPQTGLYTFADLNGDGLISSLDYTVLGTTNPKWYGGWGNQFSWRGLELSVFVQAVSQLGRHPVYGSATAPGTAFNVFTLLLDHWQKPGDVAPYQKLTISSSSGTGIGQNRISQSDAALVDASFARLKNLSLSYVLPHGLTSRIRIKAAKVYLEGQNLVTFSRFPAIDPEAQSFVSLPPLKTIALGLQLTF